MRQIMQSLNNVPNQAQAANEVAAKGKKTTTENPYDRLMDMANKEGKMTVKEKFSNVLSTLKTQLSGASSSVKNDSQDRLSKMANDTKTAMQDRNDRLKELQDEEDERKERQARLDREHERMDELNAKAQEIASMSRMDVIAQNTNNQEAQKLQDKAAQDAQDKDNSKTSRPSEILASAFARGSANGSASAAAQTSGAAISSSTASVANVTVAGVATNAAASSMTSQVASNESANLGTIGNAQGGNGSHGSSQGSGSAFGETSTFGTTSYGLDPKSEAAMAAREMMEIEGAETDAELSTKLQERNAHQLANIDSQNEAEEAMNETSRRISTLENKELKQNLDVLARETNVSKLSLQMSNPATMAAQARDAQSLSNLPTSKDAISSLNAPNQAQSKVLGSLSGETNANGSTAQAAASGIIQDASKANANAQLSSDTQVASRSRVNSVTTQESSSETLIKNANQSKLNHGAEGTSSRAAIASRGVRAVAAEASDETASNGINSGKGNLTVNKQQQILEHNRASEAYKGSEAQGSNRTNAQEALLRAAMNQVGKENLTKSLAQVTAENALVADKALASTRTGTEAVDDALASLKQGVKGGADSIKSGTTYSQSSLFASMFGDEHGVGAAASMDDSADMGSDTDHDDGTAFAAMAEVQGANLNNTQATSGASVPDLVLEKNNEADNANEIHDRVMQMAARNMKQLEVELSPNELGKMKISIELSENNDAMSVSLAAANPETRAILEKALPKLKEILAGQNIETEAVVTDIDEGAEGSEVAATDFNKPSVSTITNSAAAKRRNVNVANVENVSVDTLISNARSLSEQDRADIISGGRVSAV